MGECGLHAGTIGFIKSILHDDAPIIPNSFIVIKDLLVGIVTESILFWGTLTVHDFIVVILTNGPGVNKKLLVGVFNHICVDIPAGWLGRRTLTVHDFIVVIITNGPGVNIKLLVGVFNHISVDIPAGWLGRPWIYYRLPST